MTHQDALDRVNAEPNRALRLIEASWLKIVVMVFTIGVAWANLRAEIQQNKMESEARFAIMASDLHALKVLACRSYPLDSVCALTPP